MVDKSYYNAHTGHIFKELNLLKFQDIHFMQLGQFMSLFENAILPRKCDNIFTINNQIHNCSIQGMQIPFVYYYVEQISSFLRIFIEVLNSLILFHLKFLALHNWHLWGKNFKLILSVTINSVIK